MTACRKMICGLAGLAALAASAGTPVLTVPETAQPPAIDGRVEPGEWRDALEITRLSAGERTGAGEGGDPRFSEIRPGSPVRRGDRFGRQHENPEPGRRL